MEALVTIEELTPKLPFTMDADEAREAEGALEYLSDDARLYGRRTWATPATTPRQVKNLILRACVRHMKNYEGYTQSRAGDESVSWTDRGEAAGAAYFTEREIRALKTIAGNSAFYSVNAVAHGKSDRYIEGLVPDEGSNEPIQMFASDGDPW